MQIKQTETSTPAKVGMRSDQTHSLTHHDEIHEDEVERKPRFQSALDSAHCGGSVVRLFDHCIGKGLRFALQYSPNDLAIQRRIVLLPTMMGINIKH